MVALMTIVCFSLCSCKSRDAVAADNMILAIGEVTLDSKANIIEAEDAVESLSMEDYKQLEYIDELEKAKETYEAKQVVDLIGKIPDSIDVFSYNAIHTARSAYDKCTDEGKTQVNNYDDLVRAEEKFSKAKIENAIQAIDRVETATTNTNPNINMTMLITAANNAYNQLSDEEQSQVTNYTGFLEISKKWEAEVEEQRAQQMEQLIKESPMTNDYYNDYKASKKTVDIDGKQIWQVYAASNEVHFTGKYQGTGNFIIKILDDNQDFFDLVVNEIGDYNLDKRVYGLEPDEMYYFQIQWSYGTWSLRWDGIY